MIGAFVSEGLNETLLVFVGSHPKAISHPSFRPSLLLFVYTGRPSNSDNLLLPKLSVAFAVRAKYTELVVDMLNVYGPLDSVPSGLEALYKHTLVSVPLRAAALTVTVKLVLRLNGVPLTGLVIAVVGGAITTGDENPASL